MRGEEILTEGFIFGPVVFAVERAFQERKHCAAGIETAMFGNCADLTFLGHGALKAIDASGISMVGQVHMTQRFHQHHAVRLDEQLRVNGVVSRVQDVPRGRQVFCTFEYRRSDGTMVCDVERSGLRPGSNVERGPGRSASSPNAAVGDGGFDDVSVHQLSPEGVAGYSDNTLNPIHNDPDVAARFGFRAPIAAGLMGIHFYMAHIVRSGLPDRLEMDVRFLRPMFWDDRLVLQKQGGHLRLVNQAGKPVSEARYR